MSPIMARFGRKKPKAAGIASEQDQNLQLLAGVRDVQIRTVSSSVSVSSSSSSESMNGNTTKAAATVTKVHHLAEISDVEDTDDTADESSSTFCNTTDDIEVEIDMEGSRTPNSSDESSVYSSTEEEEDDEEEEEEKEDGESKAESLAVPEGPREEESTTEQDENKVKDDVSLTDKPDKLNDHHHGDSTESTVATQDDEASSQASDPSECGDIALATPLVETKSETEMVAPVAPVETSTDTQVDKEAETPELLQHYRDQTTSKSIAQLVRYGLMGKSANTSSPIQIRAILDELAARASIVNHDLDDAYEDHKARTNQASKNRSAIARTGGLLAIVQTMERLTAHADIQVSACRALETLALDAENETAIADVGGVEAILAAMMANFLSASVQEAAWGALWNLSCRNADSVMTLDTAGGMEAIIAAMQHHVDNPAIQRNACGTLANLCVSNDDRRAALAKSGGFVAIAAALQRHWNDSDVKDEASYALTALLEESARHYDLQLDRA